MQLTIQVTEEDIKCGAKADCRRCPIARAFGRATGLEWSVCKDSARPVDLPRFYIELPSDAQVFVHRFDYGFSAEPFTFTVEVPPELESYIKVPA